MHAIERAGKCRPWFILFCMGSDNLKWASGMEGPFANRRFFWALKCWPVGFGSDPAEVGLDWAIYRPARELELDRDRP